MGPPKGESTMKLSNMRRCLINFIVGKGAEGATTSEIQEFLLERNGADVNDPAVKQVRRGYDAASLYGRKSATGRCKGFFEVHCVKRGGKWFVNEETISFLKNEHAANVLAGIIGTLNDDWQENVQYEHGGWQEGPVDNVRTMRKSSGAHKLSSKKFVAELLQHDAVISAVAEILRTQECVYANYYRSYPEQDYGSDKGIR